VQEIRDVVERTKVSVKGLHIHTGSEIKDLEVFVKGLELVLETTQYFPDLTIIDLGGGFKVPYKPDEVGTDMEALGEKLADAFEAFEKQPARNFRFGLNPANTWSARPAISWFAPTSSSRGLQGLLLG